MTALARSDDRFDLTQDDFERLARFIAEASGIRITPPKKIMIEGRLRHRVRALGFADITEYCDYLFREDGLADEAERIIDAVSTNKTDFFREAEHFHFLTEVALPRLVRAGLCGQGETLQVWSAAASTGAEAYSLAMTLADWSQLVHPLRWSILATDICRDVLETGAAGIYPEATIAPVPQEMRRRYLLRSRDREAALVRIVPELRARVAFARLNLIDTAYRLPHAMQVVFCRNVLIYFDKPTQIKVLARICQSLAPGGFLFVGHSETITGYALPLRQVAPTVFERV
ncbi:Chemotaxis protein methyltransferase [uncultured Alphaproteobacteria bacterium]|jgi:chemotaxis protein methyltransferase CheR|uniref:Chemotaxis protein methyltransferase n=1 Tax=uncultured Alphaproteobacteria bacterium TaxID=91750 RepID=A0A212KKH7_9PROT|nr:Chemotaxis protein methyltransferase [uncultured Alphaproteobacteria bacterium]